MWLNVLACHCSTVVAFLGLAVAYHVSLNFACPVHIAISINVAYKWKSVKDSQAWVTCLFISFMSCFPPSARGTLMKMSLLCDALVAQVEMAT